MCEYIFLKQKNDVVVTHMNWSQSPQAEFPSDLSINLEGEFHSDTT